MKKILSVSTLMLLLILMGCSREYQVTFESNGRIFGAIDGHTYTFVAGSIEDLYRQVYKFVDDHANYDADILHSTTYSITLPSLPESEDVGASSAFLEHIRLQRELDLLEEQEKLYAGARFGMTANQVLELEHFKKGWMKDFDFIRNNQEKIGDGSYDVYLYFDEGDGLYCLHLWTMAWKSNYFETATMYEFENLYNVFTKVYGRPSREPVSAVRSTSVLGRGDNWICEWKVGTKTVRLGYNLTSSEKCCVIADIRDGDIQARRNRKAQEARSMEERDRETLTSESANLF